MYDRQQRGRAEVIRAALAVDVETLIGQETAA